MHAGFRNCKDIVSILIIILGVPISSLNQSRTCAGALARTARSGSSVLTNAACAHRHHRANMTRSSTTLAVWPSCLGALLSRERMVGRLRKGAARRFATTAQGKEDHPDHGNPCERDHEVGGGQRYFRCPYRERESRYMLH